MKQKDFKKDSVFTKYNGTDSHFTIPEGVMEIADEAFESCDSLVSITIPKSVRRIGRWAFYGCHSLASITIPESVTEIGKRAFGYCKALTSIIIPACVTKIGELAFEECRNLTSITISEGVTEIGDGAFACCEALTSITIPGSVRKIGYQAFEDCAKLSHIIISKGVKEIKYDALEGCGCLTSITFPKRLSEITDEYSYPNKVRSAVNLTRGFLAHPELYDDEAAGDYIDYIKCHSEDFKDELAGLSVLAMQEYITKANPAADTLKKWAELAMKLESAELVAFLMKVIHNTDGEDDPFKKFML